MSGRIEEFIPEADVQQVHQILIHAPANLVFAEAEQLSLQSVPLIRFLFWAREKLLGGSSHSPQPRAKQTGLVAGLVKMTRELGWLPLAETPNRELVMGAVTRPWVMSPVFQPVKPETFRSFAEPDLVKIAWTLEVEPTDPTHTLFRTQTRVLATDEQARTKFRRYWRRFSAGIILVRLVALRILRKAAERRFRSSPQPV